MKNKYDWPKIQIDYNNGMSREQLINKYGLSRSGIDAATRRGDFVSRSISDAVRLHLLNNPRDEAYLIKMSKSVSKAVNEKIANGTWHTSLAKNMHIDYNGVDLHGSWELSYAMYLDANNIKWIRNKDSFAYTYEGKERRYTPDFYLLETDEYIEIKGYKTAKDEAKWLQFPKHRKLKVLTKKELLLLGIKLKK